MIPRLCIKACKNHVVFLEDGHIVEESREPKAFFDRPTTDRARQFLRTFEY